MKNNCICTVFVCVFLYDVLELRHLAVELFVVELSYLGRRNGQQGGVSAEVAAVELTALVQGYNHTVQFPDM